MTLKPREDATRSPKQRYQYPTKRTDGLQNILKKSSTLASPLMVGVNDASVDTC